MRPYQFVTNGPRFGEVQTSSPVDMGFAQRDQGDSLVCSRSTKQAASRALVSASPPNQHKKTKWIFC